jgi:tripartite-type tricarboxylate transporter receptor subunit TctC
MRTVLRALLAASIGAGCLSPSAAPAADPWPQRTVKIIVPLPAGVSIDASARLFAAELSARWRQPVVVENIPGADGLLAAREFVSRNDQHTLLYSFAGLISINPFLHEKLPYEPRDLVPIAMSSDNFLAIAVSSKLQVASLGELVELARSQPTKLNWAATPGLPYFSLASLQKSTGMAMVHVAYRNFNPALIDLGEGRLDVAATGLMQVLPQQQAGKVRVLAVMNRTRSPAAPEIPTASEAGYPQLTFDGVTGFFGCKSMPDELRDRIAADVRTVSASPALQQRLSKLGIVARGSTPGEFAAAIEQQRVKVAGIAAETGAKPAP